ncbi:helix-turn-helix domain-containing protein [Porphyrobacter algicida]|uniref:Helix-turn-helix domain-containing protein n=1 Tax=Qipengyuania algicida TaxID=1836209 RepID=A0A845AAR8_9SPHN|nr:helix-turn-helix domain-containing protein [Qipengyuania algicida]MXP27340.1 helix-turn-helix domain-containing protein [Qipengyuania algicida]
MASKYSLHDSERRQEERRNLLFATTGAAENGEEGPVLVRDISSQGILVETDEALPLGTALELELPGAGRVSARVIWQGEKLAGCRLEGTVSQDTIDAVRESGAAAHARSEETPSEPRASAASSLARRLKQLRLDRDLTRAELAEKSGISTPSIWAWETGRTVPRLQSLEILAKGLGVPVTELQIGGSPGMLESIGGMVESNEDGMDLRSIRLAELVEASKIQIAMLAGTTPDRVAISITL